MFAAASYKLLKNYEIITAQNIQVLLVGNIVAFIVAMIAIKTFIALLTRYGFRMFGYYRILVGLVIIGFLLAGYDLNLAE